jgi:hypothetical protein
LLNHLISRDKFIDRMGLDSDIVLLHYKYGSLQPKTMVITPHVTAVALVETAQMVVPEADQSQDQKETRQVVTHAQLSRMSVSDRCKALRDQRQAFKTDKAENPENVPSEWPLPKEGLLPGESCKDEAELTPEQFSQRLVGGRRGEF